ncbi:MAG: hypothetical protein ACJ8KU_10095 [Chthoniobacterales bacterium]
MSPTLKWQIAFALLCVFLAGLAVGAFGTVHIHRGMLGPRPEHLGGRLSEHLRRELRLTPEQFDKVHPAIERGAEQLEQIRSETERRVNETMRQMHDEIGPLLTPEQKAKLGEMHERHMQMLHRHGPHGPPP